MSNNPSPQALLTAIVLDSAPGPICALHRYPYEDPKNINALAAARSLGFSTEEGYGIMRGWDRARNVSLGNGHFSVCFDDKVQQMSVEGRERARFGEALGVALFALAVEHNLYVPSPRSALAYMDGI